MRDTEKVQNCQRKKNCDNQKNENEDGPAHGDHTDRKSGMALLTGTIQIERAWDSIFTVLTQRCQSGIQYLEESLFKTKAKYIIFRHSKAENNQETCYTRSIKGYSSSKREIKARGNLDIHKGTKDNRKGIYVGKYTSSFLLFQSLQKLGLSFLK